MRISGPISFTAISYGVFPSRFFLGALLMWSVHLRISHCVRSVNTVPFGRIMRSMVCTFSIPGFLVAAHGITIKNTGSGISFWIAFKLIRSSKFLSPVCKYDRHQESEFIRIPQSTLQMLKNSFQQRPGNNDP